MNMHRCTLHVWHQDSVWCSETSGGLFIWPGRSFEDRKFFTVLLNVEACQASFEYSKYIRHRSKRWNVDLLDATVNFPSVGIEDGVEMKRSGRNQSSQLWHERRHVGWDRKQCADQFSVISVVKISCWRCSVQIEEELQWLVHVCKRDETQDHHVDGVVL